MAKSPKPEAIQSTVEACSAAAKELSKDEEMGIEQSKASIKIIAEVGNLNKVGFEVDRSDARTGPADTPAQSTPFKRVGHPADTS